MTTNLSATKNCNSLVHLSAQTWKCKTGTFSTIVNPVPYMCFQHWYVPHSYSPSIPLYCGAWVIPACGSEYWRHKRVFTTHIGFVTERVPIPRRAKYNLLHFITSYRWKLQAYKLSIHVCRWWFMYIVCFALQFSSKHEQESKIKSNFAEIKL